MAFLILLHILRLLHLVRLTRCLLLVSLLTLNLLAMSRGPPSIPRLVIRRVDDNRPAFELEVHTPDLGVASAVEQASSNASSGFLR
jgi:hypothetical protein